jgi:hypothetical protein
MRLAVAVLCVLALTGSASAADADRTLCVDTKVRPPAAYRGEPSVKWTVFYVPERKLRTACGYTGPRTVHSCTFPADGYWAIIMPDNISLDEYACRLAYEKAHMPPYFWGDANLELPETMTWLAEQKAAYKP